MSNFRITKRETLAYCCGMAGWSILINVMSVMLIYFYLPPADTGLTPLIPAIIYLGIFSVLALIAAGGRLFDAITDPLIAWMSDRTESKRGRRIPFMRVGWIPAFVFCIAVFFPLKPAENQVNIYWLLATLTLFYFSLTVYFIPYNALMPELAPTEREKVKLSTWLSLAYVSGLIIAAQTPLLASWIEEAFGLAVRIRTFQFAIAILASVAGVLLLVPVIGIDEKKCCTGRPARMPLKDSLGMALRNYNFRLFLFADFSYFLAVAIISSGMLYYLRVLLGLHEAHGSSVFGLMIVVSLMFYPLILHISKFVRKKWLVSFALIFLGLIFLGIFFLGNLPFPPRVQIYTFALLASVPFAILGIIPYAIIAEVAQLDSLKTGMGKEGMYFAIRNFFYKLGMTAGIMIFTILTLWGKDPGDDFGIRMNGIAGSLFCILAGLTFMLFREKQIQKEINDLKNQGIKTKQNENRNFNSRG